MNKPQKNYTNTKLKRENESFLGRCIKKVTRIKKFFRKIWRNILLFFTISLDNRRYPPSKRPHNIRDWFKYILKFGDYCVNFLNKTLKLVRRYIFYIIMFLVASFILINNEFEFDIFIEYFLGGLSDPIFVINFIIIFLIIAGIIWWFITPGGRAFGYLSLRIKGISLRLLFAVILIFVFYFSMSYPPGWLAEAEIIYSMSVASHIEKAWLFIPKRLSNLDEPLNIRNIVIGVFGLISLIFLWWRNKIADNNFKLEEIKRLDIRFDMASKALSETLKPATYSLHIEAITTITQLAHDNKDLIQRCLDVICNCNEWMRPYVDEFKCGPTDKCYSEIEIFNDISPVINKSTKNKDKNNNLKNKNKYKASLVEQKRSQKALCAIAEILRKISNDERKMNITSTRLSDLNFSTKILCGINLRRLHLEGIDLNEAYLNGADLREANLNNAKLQDAKLNGANLSEIKLRKANLTGAHLIGSILLRANLSRANMYSAELQSANLFRAKLSGAILSKSNLQFANLNNSLLFGANLDYAKLQGAQLRKAQLVGASLRKTHLEGSNMKLANLQATYFYETQLLGANLDLADLSYAILWEVNFYGANLTNILSCYYGIKKTWGISFINDGSNVNLPLIFSGIPDITYKAKNYQKEWFDNITKYVDSSKDKKQFIDCIKKACEAWKDDERQEELKKLISWSVISLDNNRKKGSHKKKISANSKKELDRIMTIVSSVFEEDEIIFSNSFSDDIPKNKAKKTFVIKDDELVKELLNKWSQWAILYPETADNILLWMNKTLFIGVGANKKTQEITSKYSRKLYRKLKKTPELKKAYKRISRYN